MSRPPTSAPALVLVLLAAASAGAQTWEQLDPSLPPDPGKPALVALDTELSNELETTLRVTIYGFWNEVVVGEDGKTYNRLTFPGLGTIGQVGAPDLPAVRVDVAVGHEAEALQLVGVETLDVVQFETLVPLPTYVPGEDEEFDPTYDPGPGDTDGTEPAWAYDPGIYEVAAIWPPEFAEPAAPIGPMLGPIRGATATIYPVEFDPVTPEVSITNSFLVTFVADGAPLEPVEITRLRDEEAGVQFINWEETDIFWPYDAQEYHSRYLIVADSMWWGVLEPFEIHKRKLGYQVSTIDAGSTVDGIRDAIASWYALGEPGTDHFVLLVGDTNQIPLVPIFEPGVLVLTDDAYGCVGPLDTSKEVHVGRISADDLDALDRQLDKIREYELDPAPGNYGEALLVSHEEGAPGKYTGSHLNVANASYTAPPMFTAAFGDAGASNLFVQAVVNDGVGVVAYRGHGSTSTWWEWNTLGESFHKNDLGPQLVNDMMPVVWAITCTNSNLDYEVGTSQDCISEVWMEVVNGAVSAYGATRTTSTVPNHHLNETLFEVVFDQGVTTQAKALELAEASVWTQWPDHKNPWAYVLLGDPSMTIRRGQVLSIGLLGVPAGVSLDAPPGSLSLTALSETSDEVLVSAYKASFLGGQPDETCGAYWVDGNDDVVVPVTLATPGTLYLTARDGDGNATQQQVEVGMGQAWEDLGAELAGDGVAPRLAGMGTLVEGTTWSLLLADAPPLATASLAVGFAELNAPFKGGVMVPDIGGAGVLLPLPVDGDGNLVLPGAWPAGIPGGLEILFQAWIPDAAGPKGFVASNAVRATTPF